MANERADDEPRRDRFAPAWLRFTNAAKKDLSQLPARRPVDQFIQFRDAVLKEITDPTVVGEIDDSLSELAGDEKMSGVADLVTQELNAYAAAVDVAHADAKASAGMGGARPPVLARLGRTAIDSFREIVDLSPRLKALMKLFSELFELFES